MMPTFPFASAALASMPATQTKRPPDRPTVLSLTAGVDALDFALAVRQCHSMGMVSCLLLVLAGARTLSIKPKLEMGEA